MSEKFYIIDLDHLAELLGEPYASLKEAEEVVSTLSPYDLDTPAVITFQIHAEFATQESFKKR